MSPLTVYQADGTKKLAPVAPALPQRVSVLPSILYEGREVYFVAGANGELWHLRYNASVVLTTAGGSYKNGTGSWEFIGGSPLEHQVDADQSTSNPVYVDLATVGPSIAVPLAGDYIIGIGCNIYTSTGAGLSS